MKVALFTKLDISENNEHIFSVIDSLAKNKIDFEIDGESYDSLSSINNKIQSINRISKLNKTYDFAI